jgi:RNA polymerase sigma-70 factor (ECF subfamily)
MKKILEEAKFLDRARSGDPSAIAQLYELYGDTVYRIGYRLTGSPMDAEDVLQDVFLGLPRALHTYAGRGSLEGWIKRVASRTTLMKLRLQKRKAEVALDHMPPDQAEGVGSERTPVDRMELEDAVGTLPEALRTVFVLRDVEGYTHSEIGEMLGIGKGASRVRLHRARRILRKHLEHSV